MADDGLAMAAVRTSPRERVANNGMACDQPPARDEAEDRGGGVECQQSYQSRKAQRKHEAERARRYPPEPGADAAQRWANPVIQQHGHGLLQARLET